LANHPIAAKALAQHELRERVVAWKSQFFGSGWAHYDLAKPGTFKLVPQRAREAALRRDYQAMRDMYLKDPMEFEQILAQRLELKQMLRDHDLRRSHAGHD
jgi:hypothetical protein